MFCLNELCVHVLQSYVCAYECGGVSVFVFVCVCVCVCVCARTAGVQCQPCAFSGR